MEIKLSNRCKSLTGSLGRGFGYYIKSHRPYRSGKERFFSQRCSKGSVPPDGHWRFIITCAELAQNGLYIADIEVTGYELKIALSEACFLVSSLCVDLDHVYSAKDVLQFKMKHGL